MMAIWGKAICTMPLPPAPPLFHVLPPPPVFAGQSFILIRMIIFLLYVYFSRIVAQGDRIRFTGQDFYVDNKNQYLVINDYVCAKQIRPRRSARHENTSN